MDAGGVILGVIGGGILGFVIGIKVTADAVANGLTSAPPASGTSGLPRGAINQQLAPRLRVAGK
jgi:hypothetical protein